MCEKDLLELINRVECSVGKSPLYYFSHHSLINRAIDYFKDSDVIVVDSKTGKRYQRGTEMIEKQNNIRRGRWIFWGGWRGNHDLRIDDATCSECGYEHPTVRFGENDTKDGDVYATVLNKLSDKCPKCAAVMQRDNQ